MCTLLLLLLFSLLLYVRQVDPNGIKCHKEPNLYKAPILIRPVLFQVLLSSGWDKPAWRLEILRPTSSSRVLLGTNRVRVSQEPLPVRLKAKSQSTVLHWSPVSAN